MSGQIVDAQQRSLPRSQVLSYRATQQEWIGLLAASKYRGSILFELPMNVEQADELESALAAVNRAKGLLHYGHYDDVVANCRKALEIIRPQTVSIEALRTGQKKTMKKSDRFFLAVDQIAKLTHLGHHLDHEQEYVSFTRSEAVFVLGSTVAALSCYSEYLAGRKVQLDAANALIERT